MSDHLLSQSVDKPTRNANILDVLLTNNPRYVGCVKSTDTRLSDHNLVEITMLYNPQQKLSCQNTPMWDPMGFRSMDLDSAHVESITYKLNDIDWDILVDLCEQSNHGDEDGSYFSELFRLTILQIYLENVE